MEHAKVQLRLLGAFSASAGARDLTSVLSQPKRIGLIAWLLLNRPPGLHRRDTLCAMLYPDSPTDNGRAALRQLLATLRRELGETMLVTEGDLVGLNQAVVTSDVTQVLDALDADRDAEGVGRYTGELLPGLHVGECDMLDRWLEAQRSELKQRVTAAAWRLVEVAEGRRQTRESRHLAERALAIDSDDEKGLRRVLTLQARDGDRAAALTTYETFARRLQMDWGAEPEPATRELIEQIRSGRLAEPAPRTPQSVMDPLPVSRESGNDSTAVERVSPRRNRRGRAMILAGAGVLGLISVVAVRLAAVERSLVPGRVLVVPFANHTGDPGLAPMGLVAADWVIQGLQHSGYAEVVDPGTAYLTTHDLGDQSAGAMAQLRQLARGTRAGLVVVGSIARVRDSAEYSARVADVRTGRILRVVEPIRAAMVDPGPALNELRSRIAGAIASETDVPMAPLARGDRPPRIEAYREFVAGLPLFTTGAYLDAARRFERAWLLDSSFSQSAMWLAYALWNGGMGDSGDAVTKRLAERPGGMTPLVKAELDAFAFRTVDVLSFDEPTDPVPAFIAARRLAARLSPGSENEWKLAVALTRNAGRHREAVQVLQGLDLQRNWITRWERYWDILVEALHLAGDHRGEVAAAQRAKAIHPGFGWWWTGYAALGDTETLKQGARTAINLPGGVAAVGHPAIELEAHGYLQKAIDFLEWGEPLVRERAERLKTSEARVDHAATLAFLAVYRNDRKAAAAARAALEPFLDGHLGQTGDDQTGTIARLVAYIPAVCVEGDSARIARLPSPVPAPWTPMELAQIAACQGDFDEAFRRLEQAGHFLHLHVLPGLRALRKDPRYKAWLHPEDYDR